MKEGEVISLSTDGVAMFWCPGCECYHGVWVGKPNELTGAQWTWNGDKVKPTFNPSILVHGTRFKKGTDETVDAQCHSFVRDGMIEFLSDCAHQLAGQTVPLPTDDQIKVTGP
jgi:hypothetical protein